MASYVIWIVLRVVFMLFEGALGQQTVPAYYEEDIVKNSTQRRVLEIIRDESLLRSKECRIDFCKEMTTSDAKKGSFTWPETTTGQRMYVRCPYSYSFQAPVYAYRDCLLDPEMANHTEFKPHRYMLWEAIWADPDVTSCPDPPMEETLRRRKIELGQGSTWFEYLRALAEINRILKQYSDEPVTYRDIIDIVLILYKAVTEGVQHGNRLDRTILQDAFEICDFVLGHDREFFSVQPLETIRLWLLEILGLLTEMLFPIDRETEVFIHGRYFTIGATVTSGSGETVFYSLAPNNTTRNTTIPVDIKVKVLDQGNYVVHVMYLWHTDVVNNEVDVITYEERKSTVQEEETTTSSTTKSQQTTTASGNSVTTNDHVDVSTNVDMKTTTQQEESTTHSTKSQQTTISGDSSDAVSDRVDRMAFEDTSLQGETTTPSTTNAEQTTASNGGSVTENFDQDSTFTGGSNEYEATQTPEHASNLSTQMYNDFGQTTEADDSNPNRGRGSTSRRTATTASPAEGERIRRDVNPTRTYLQLSTSIDLVAPIAYVSVSERHILAGFRPSWDQKYPRVEVVMSTKHQLLNLKPGTEMSTKCTNINTYVEFKRGERDGFSMDTWYIDPTECEAQIGDDMACSCSTLGFFTIMGIKDISTLGGLQPIPSPIASTVDNTMTTEYTIFKYHRGVHVAGHIIRAFCLLFLGLTVLSYAIFRQAGKGQATYIMLNICVSLILVVLVLYVAEGVAHDQWGCRLVSAFRYYFVLVSLMLVGVEAIHIYLSLIEVSFSYYVLTAAFVAWGIPLLAVAIVLGVDQHAFDGRFDDRCIFRCMLNDDMAYFAYIIPMGVIIILNIIVYALTIKILIQQEDSSPTEKGWADWARMTGSFIMTALLGIAWLFSAFAIIDGGHLDLDIDITQGVYQIVLVIFLLLQALFVFTFYCGSNPDMRSRWRATFEPRLSRSSVAATAPNEGNEIEVAHESDKYITRESNSQP